MLSLSYNYSIEFNYIRHDVNDYLILSLTYIFVVTLQFLINNYNIVLFNMIKNVFTIIFSVYLISSNTSYSGYCSTKITDICNENYPAMHNHNTILCNSIFQYSPKFWRPFKTMLINSNFCSLLLFFFIVTTALSSLLRDYRGINQKKVNPNMRFSVI